MISTQLFHTKNEMVDYISQYLIGHDKTIAIIKGDLRTDIIKALLNEESFNKLNDTADSEEEVLFIIKTGDKQNQNLSIKICNAYNTKTRFFKMIDINNILLVDGLISQDEISSINYYEEFTKLQITNVA